MRRILFILVSFVFFSCEETVTDFNFDYKEQLVIYCFLEAGKPVDNISIFKTLPLDGNNEFENGLISDAAAFIYDGDQAYELEYYFNGRYYNNDLIPEAGKKYRLEVKWKDYFATAETTIPFPSKIDSVEFNKTEIHYNDAIEYNIAMYVLTHPKPLGCYLAGMYWFSDTESKYYFDRPKNTADTLNDGFLKITAQIWSSYDVQPGVTFEKLFYLDTYDPAYYDYYLSKGNDDDFDFLFGSSGKLVKWNVKGDGIGIFVGYSTDTIRKQFTY